MGSTCARISHTARACATTSAHMGNAATNLVARSKNMTFSAAPSCTTSTHIVELPPSLSGTSDGLKILASGPQTCFAVGEGVISHLACS